MATADEIFVMTAEEPHIVIDSDRTIKIPNSLKRLAVQHDHNIETVTFDCPRYWDNHDMSKMAVYINYMLSDGYTDSYPVDNVTVDGDVMHFTWTISRNVTHVSGVINFLVCVKNTDDEGNEVNHWNSELCQDAYISKGMENEEIGALEQTDLITSLLLRMDSVEKINIKADEMQALLEETQAVAAAAEEVKNEALDTSNHIKNSYANALKGNASGEVVRVDDVSPIEHTVEVNVRSKNRFDISKVINGSYVTNNGDGTITVTTSESSSAVPIEAVLFKDLAPEVKAGKTYTITANSTGEHKRVWFNTNDTWNFGEAKVVTEEMLKSPIFMYASGNSTTAVISNIQIEEGDTATEYEPYIDPSTVTVSRYGKNLFPSFEDQTANGITLKKVNDYYVLNGTATQEGLFQKMEALQSGRYTLSANNPTHNSIETAIVQVYSPTIGMLNIAPDNRVNSKITIDIEGAVDYFFRIRYEKGVTYNNYVVKPQLEIGDVATEYEEYMGFETYTPDQNGDVAITSVSPTMTVFTDTPGVTIDLEYNRDTNKAFAELVEMINSK